MVFLLALIVTLLVVTVVTIIFVKRHWNKNRNQNKSTPVLTPSISNTSSISNDSIEAFYTIPSYIPASMSLPIRPKQKIPKRYITTNQFTKASKDLCDVLCNNIFLHPEYDFLFFDDEACEDFIEKHFEHDIQEAFLQIIPGAFRADLFRYCYLYIYGGIYLDINKKFLVNLSTFIEPIHDMVLVQDRMPKGIFQAFIAIVPKHPLMYNTIKTCVHNIQNKVSKDVLEITGPIVLQDEFIKMYGKQLGQIKNPSIGVLRFINEPLRVFDHNNKEVIDPHPIDKEQFQKLSNKSHYGAYTKYYADVFLIKLPKIKTFYQTQDYRNNLCITYSKRSIPKLFEPIVNHNLKMNSTGTTEFYHESSRKRFIQNHFNNDVVEAYEKLIPGSYKADLFRFCYQYIRGGIYLDFNKKLLIPVKTIPTNFDILFTHDLDGSNISTAFLISKPGLPYWKDVIERCVKNVFTKFYGQNSLDPTGPGLLKKVFQSHFKIQDLPKTRGIHTFYGIRAMVWEMKKIGDKLIILNEKDEHVIDMAPLPPDYRNKIMTDDTHIANYGHLYNERKIYQP